MGEVILNRAAANPFAVLEEFEQAWIEIQAAPARLQSHRERLLFLHSNPPTAETDPARWDAILQRRWKAYGELETWLEAVLVRLPKAEHAADALRGEVAPERTGLGAIVIGTAVVLGVAALAALSLIVGFLAFWDGWRRYMNLEERRFDLIEDGVLQPEDLPPTTRETVVTVAKVAGWLAGFATFVWSVKTIGEVAESIRA